MRPVFVPFGSAILLLPLMLMPGGPGVGAAAAQDVPVEVRTNGGAPTGVDIVQITGGSREAVAPPDLGKWLSTKPKGTRIIVYEKTMCENGRTVLVLRPESERLPDADQRCVNKNATTGDPCGCDEIGSLIVGDGRTVIDTGTRSVVQLFQRTAPANKIVFSGVGQWARLRSDLGEKSCEPFKAALPFSPECSSEDGNPAWGIGFDVTWRPRGAWIGVNGGIGFGQTSTFRYENVATSGVQKVYNRGEVKIRTMNIRVGPSLGNEKLEVVPHIGAYRTVGEGTSSDERTVNGVKAAGESIDTRASTWSGVGVGVAAMFKVSEFFWIGANWNRIRSAAFSSPNRSRGPDKIRMDTLSALIALRYPAMIVR